MEQGRELTGSDRMTEPSLLGARGVEHLDRLWSRHGRTFWALHSVWALAPGAYRVVLRTADNRVFGAAHIRVP